ncbi:class I SAM-dependent methyltransferase [Shewanella youngdeokensis]|uniref:Class I SAM-dependent methyltransferase n=1 Tax=Shewanella youngdeokensis TaxID=2999068 RepID=A0ABZ0JY77_9GAMM|nr:class I SAM-dependent methyltransferase [Shewanella sp. DAU334]
MWDEQYDTQEYIYGKQPNDFLASHYDAVPKGKVLLLAEGEGRNAVFMAKMGYSVTAVDLSNVGLKKAQQLAKENHVSIETICADLALFDLGENQWDGIVSIYCHLPSPLRQDLYQRIERAIKPGGVFLLEAYRPEQLAYKTGGPSDASMMISTHTLLNELPHFIFSHLAAVERVINEGRNHHGLGAVVQAIGSLK